MDQKSDELSDSIRRSITSARYEYTPRSADRPALAERYVLPHTLTGVAVWREKGLLDDVTVNGRHYYVLSAKAVELRDELTEGK